MRLWLLLFLVGLPAAAQAQDRRPAVSGDRPVAASGFQVSVFARGVGSIEAMAVHGPSGDVLAIDSARGRVLRLRDRNKDGISEIKSTWLSGFDRPSGIAVGDDRIFIADARGVWHAPSGGGLTARAPAVLLADMTKVKTAPMPRPLALLDDGKTLLVGLSALSARDEEAAPAGSVIAVDTHTGRASVYASGLRSVTALSVSKDGKVAALVDESPPAADYVALIEKGGFYGWPYAYGSQTPVVGLARRDPYKVATMRAPLFTLGDKNAGTALLMPWGSGGGGPGTGDITLIAGERSLNILLYNPATAMLGDEEASPDEMLSGFGSSRGAMWGEPSALVYDGFGGLLVGDRFAQTVWRVSGSAPKIAPLPPVEAEPDLTPDAPQDLTPDVKKPLKFRSQTGGARPVGEDR